MYSGASSVNNRGLWRDSRVARDCTAARSNGAALFTLIVEAAADMPV
jgi:hypothetical protein